jgi:hypothetical protein
MPAISALRRQRHGDGAALVCIARPYLKNKNNYHTASKSENTI